MSDDLIDTLQWENLYIEPQDNTHSVIKAKYYRNRTLLFSKIHARYILEEEHKDYAKIDDETEKQADGKEKRAGEWRDGVPEVNLFA